MVKNTAWRICRKRKCLGRAHLKERWLGQPLILNLTAAQPSFLEMR